MVTTSEVLQAVQQRFGIAFTEVGTGGGCMALEARLESGHWIVATDENLMGFQSRVERENGTDIDGDRNAAMGWMVGIYPNNTEHGDDWWGGGDDAIVDVTDYDAYADELPDVVARALEQFMAAAR